MSMQKVIFNKVDDINELGYMNKINVDIFNTLPDDVNMVRFAINGKYLVQQSPYRVDDNGTALYWYNNKWNDCNYAEKYSNITHFINDMREHGDNVYKNSLYLIKHQLHDLIDRKSYPSGLSVVKYAKRVFWDNLWSLYDELLETRGRVEYNGKTVALPFKKVFNYQENNTTCDLATEVVSVEKVNGFMLHVTLSPEKSLMQSLKSAFIWGTTGSLDSNFVTLGRETFKKHRVNTDIIALFKPDEVHTFIFEIKDNEKDPHIIDDEADGVYLLGVRNVKTGKLLPQSTLDELALEMGARRPKWKKVVFGDLLTTLPNIKHEGFVIYDVETNDAILKLKSPFYTTKKWIMRRGNEFVFDSDYREKVDEEYYPIIARIRKHYTRADWAMLSEVEKGKVFNDMLANKYYSTEERIKFITHHPKLTHGINELKFNTRLDAFTNTWFSEVMFKHIDAVDLVPRYETIMCDAKTFEKSLQLLTDTILNRFGDYVYTSTLFHDTRRASLVTQKVEIEKRINDEFYLP